MEIADRNGGFDVDACRIDEVHDGVEIIYHLPAGDRLSGDDGAGGGNDRDPRAFAVALERLFQRGRVLRVNSFGDFQALLRGLDFEAENTRHHLSFSDRVSDPQVHSEHAACHRGAQDDVMEGDGGAKQREPAPHRSRRHLGGGDREHGSALPGAAFLLVCAVAASGDGAQERGGKRQRDEL